MTAPAPIQPLAPAPARSRRRKWLAVLGLGFGGLLLLLLLAPSLVPTEWIRVAVVRQAEQNLKCHCSLEAISLGWWRGVSLRGLALSPIDQPTTPVLAIERLDLQADLLPLLRRRLLVRTIRIEGMDLSLARDEAGRLNLEDLLPPSAAPAVPAAGVSFSLMAEACAAEAGTAAATLGFDDVRILGSIIRYREPARKIDAAWKIDRLDVAAADPNRKITVDGELAPDGGAGRIRLQASADLLEGNAFDPAGTAEAKLQVEGLDLGPVLRMAGTPTAPPVAPGVFDGPVTVRLEGGAWTVEAAGGKVVRASAGSMLPLPDLDFVLLASVDPASAALQVARCQVGGKEGRVSASGPLGWATGALQGTLEVEGRVEWTALADFLRARGAGEPSAPADPVAEILVALKGATAVQGKVELGAEAVRLSLSLPECVVEGPAAGGTTGADLKGDLVLTASGRTAQAKFVFRESGLGIAHPSLPDRARVSLPAGESVLDWDGTTLRLSGLWREAAATVSMPGEEKPLTAGLSGAFTFQSGAEAPSGTLTIEQGRIEWPAAGLRKPAAALLAGVFAWAGDKDRLEIRQLMLAADPGRVRVQGEWTGLAAGTPAGRLSLKEGTVDLAALGALFLPPSAAPRAALSGRCALEGDVRLERGVWGIGLSAAFEQARILNLPDIPAIEFGPRAPFTLAAVVDGATGSARFDKLEFASLPVSASLRGTLAGGVAGFGYSLQMRPTRAEALARVLGLPEGTESILWTGTLTAREEVFSFAKTKVQAAIGGASGWTVEGSHDLKLALRGDKLETLEIEALRLAAKPAKGDAPILEAVVSEGKILKCTTAPEGNLRLRLSADTQLAVAFLQKAGAGIPALQAALAGAVASRPSAAFHLEGSLSARPDRWTADLAGVFDDLVLRDAAGAPMVQDKQVKAALQGSWDEAAALLSLDRVAIETSGRTIALGGSLKASLQPGAVPGAFEWTVSEGSALAFSLDAAKARAVLPAFLPEDFPAAGGAAASLTLVGPLSSLRVQGNASAKGMALRLGGDPAASALILSDAKATLGGVLRLLEVAPAQAGPPPAPLAAFLRSFELEQGRLAIDRFEIGPRPVRDFQAAFEVKGGVLRIDRASLDSGGVSTLAGAIDCNGPVPLGDLQVRPPQVTLGEMLGAVPDVGKFQDGMIRLPAPEAGPEAGMRIRWQGLTGEEIQRTLTVSECPFRIENIVLLAAENQEWGYLLNHLGPESAMLVSNAVKRKTPGRQNALARIAMKQASGAFTVRDGVLQLGGIDFEGENTADFRIEGKASLVGELDLSVYIVRNVEQTILVSQILSTILERLQGVAGMQLGEETKERILSDLPELMEELGRKRRLKIRILGPMDKPEVTGVEEILKLIVTEEVKRQAPYLLKKAWDEKKKKKKDPAPPAPDGAGAAPGTPETPAPDATPPAGTETPPPAQEEKKPEEKKKKSSPLDELLKGFGG